MQDRSTTTRPATWLADQPGPVRAAALATLVAAIGVAIWWSLRTDLQSGLGAGVAILIAGGVCYLAWSIARTAPDGAGSSPEGLLLGGGLMLSSMVAWTYPKEAVWVIQGAVLLVCLIATYPWWREWTAPLKLGAFWLGAPIWAYGVLSAVLVGALTVGAQRVVYGGYALAATLLVVHAVRRRDRDVTVGITVGILAGLGLLLLAGCPYVFETVGRHTADNGYGLGQDTRFWGGPLMTFHPNAYAMAAILVAGRLGPDRRFPRWLRIWVLLTAEFVLYLAQSRTAFLLGLLAAGIYAAVTVWRRGAPRLWLSSVEWRRATGKALIPFAVTAMVVAISGGIDMLTQSRYQPEDQPEPVAMDGAGWPAPPRWFNAALSGRPDIWWLILDDFRTDTVVEKAFGNTDDTRGTILRYQDPNHEFYEVQDKLSADNTLMAALRRGGVVGLLTVVAAFLVILWRTTRSHAPPWAPVIALVALAQAGTEDELVFTTLPWLMLLGIEAWIRWGRPVDQPEPLPDPATVAQPSTS